MCDMEETDRGRRHEVWCDMEETDRGRRHEVWCDMEETCGVTWKKQKKCGVTWKKQIEEEALSVV